MARGSTTATNAANTSATNSGTLTSNANSLYGTLAPTLETNMATPPGFAPADEAAIVTGAQQNAGGTQAAAVGAGNLNAARTRNAGGFGQAVSDASRGAGETLSKGLLNIQNQNAELKQHQRDAATNGLEGLYGTNVGGANQALGNVAPLVNANTNAVNASYDTFKDVVNPLIQDALSGAATGGKIAQGCWIAEAIYGVDDPRTHLVRAWLNGPFRERSIGNLVMSVYLAIGQQIAWIARRSSWLRTALKPLLDVALRKATE